MARKKIEPNISYDDKRRSYYVYMDYGVDETGTRVRKYKTYPNLNAARKALREFHVERSMNQNLVPRKLTLSDWLEYWMKEVIGPNRAVTTLYGYRKIIENHLDPALGDVPLQKLTPSHLQSYYTMLLRDKELSPNTVRRHHDLLSAALHAAVRHDVLLRSPTERVEPPRTTQTEIGYYGPSELKELYVLVQDTWLEVIVKLAGSLGLRREEICGLRWDCVDFQQRKIHICQARTAAGAVIVEKETKTRSSTRALYMTDACYIPGIGINLAQPADFFAARGLPHGGSLLSLTGVSCDLKTAAEALYDALLRRLDAFAAGGFPAIAAEYRAACVNLGKEVYTDTLRGTAVAVDDAGRLVVRTAEGETAVFTGEVTVRGIY